MDSLKENEEINTRSLPRNFEAAKHPPYMDGYNPNRFQYYNSPFNNYDYFYPSFHPSQGSLPLPQQHPSIPYPPISTYQQHPFNPVAPYSNHFPPVMPQQQQPSQPSSYLKNQSTYLKNPPTSTPMLTQLLQHPTNTEKPTGEQYLNSVRQFFNQKFQSHWTDNLNHSENKNNNCNNFNNNFSNNSKTFNSSNSFHLNKNFGENDKEQTEKIGKVSNNIDKVKENFNSKNIETDPHKNSVRKSEDGLNMSHKNDLKLNDKLEEKKEKNKNSTDSNHMQNSTEHNDVSNNSENSIASNIDKGKKENNEKTKEGVNKQSSNHGSKKNAENKSLKNASSHTTPQANHTSNNDLATVNDNTLVNNNGNNHDAILSCTHPSSKNDKELKAQKNKSRSNNRSNKSSKKSSSKGKKDANGALSKTSKGKRSHPTDSDSTCSSSTEVYSNPDSPTSQLSSPSSHASLTSPSPKNSTQLHTQLSTSPKQQPSLINGTKSDEQLRNSDKGVEKSGEKNVETLKDDEKKADNKGYNYKNQLLKPSSLDNTLNKVVQQNKNNQSNSSGFSQRVSTDNNNALFQSFDRSQSFSQSNPQLNPSQMNQANSYPPSNIQHTSHPNMPQTHPMHQRPPMPQMHQPPHQQHPFHLQHQAHHVSSPPKQGNSYYYHSPQMPPSNNASPTFYPNRPPNDYQIRQAYRYYNNVNYRNNNNYIRGHPMMHRPETYRHEAFNYPSYRPPFQHYHPQQSGPHFGPPPTEEHTFRASPLISSPRPTQHWGMMSGGSVLEANNSKHPFQKPIVSMPPPNHFNALSPDPRNHGSEGRDEGRSQPPRPGSSKESHSRSPCLTPAPHDSNHQHKGSSWLERGEFMQRLKNLTGKPQSGKLDLFALYQAVKMKGGMIEVTKHKRWREVSSMLALGSSSSAGFTLKKNYARFLYPYECKYDRGDIDPAIFLASIDKNYKKNETHNVESDSASNHEDLIDSELTSPCSHVSLTSPPHFRLKLEPQGGLANEHPPYKYPSSHPSPHPSNFSSYHSPTHQQHPAFHSSNYPSIHPHQRLPFADNRRLHEDNQGSWPQHTPYRSEPPRYGLMSNLLSSSNMNFPMGSVEATKPSPQPPARLTLRHISPVDTWRVLMALKSGLAAETSWALDILMILSATDATMACLPGVLEALCSHLRWILVSLFPKDNFQELEINAHVQNKLKRRREGDEGAEHGTIIKRFYLETDEIEQINKVAKKSEGIEELKWYSKKEWDVEDGIESGCFDWMMGRGDTTQHIVPPLTTSFPPPFKKLVCENKNNDLEYEIDVDELLDSPKEEPPSDENIVKEEKVDLLPIPRVKRKPYDRHEKLLKSIKEVNLFVDDSSAPLSCSQLEAIFTLSLDQQPFKPLYEEYHEDENIKHGFLDGEVLGVEEEAFAEVGDEMGGVVKRCLLISSLLRNLSFVSDKEIVSHCGVVTLLSRLLLFKHRHKQLDVNQNISSTRTNQKDVEKSEGLKCEEGSWWWSVAENLREDAMVVLANVAGRMDLTNYPDEVVKPLVDALLHWMVCPFEEPKASVSVSFRRLSLEALCKLCVLDNNVDLIFAMPPFARIFSLFTTLVNLFENRQPLVVREMSIGLISRLMPSHPSVSRILALQRSFISSLIDFLESILDGRLSTVDTSHHHHSMHHPFSASTSIDVLNRVASTLRSLSENPENFSQMARHQQRLLMLATHGGTPRSVSATLAHILANCP